MPNPDLTDKLTPKHLVPSVSEAREALEERDEEAESPPPDPRAQREYVFHFKHGPYEGTFKNKVLTVGDRKQVGVLRATISGGLPFETLDPLTREITLILAHLEFSLLEKPEWAKDLEKVEDYRLLQKLYEEVLSHESTFLSGIEDSGKSKA